MIEYGFCSNYTPAGQRKAREPRIPQTAMEFSEPVVAAIIAATATLGSALVQLRVAARKQAAERAAGRPATKTNRWLAIVGLMLASAVGGYAFSEYRGFSQREDDRMLRSEMHSRLKDIGAMAVRIEKANLQTGVQSDADTRSAVERKRGIEGVAAVAGVSACRPQQAGGASVSSACTEADAQRSAICSVIPATASVTEVLLFLRAEDAQQPWSEARVEPGQDAGGARFVDTFYERGRDADTKEICMGLAYWASDRGRNARIVVRYTL